MFSDRGIIEGTSFSGAGNRESIMKLRLFALTAALLTLSDAAPWSFSQEQGGPTPRGQGAPDTAAPNSAPAPPPAAVAPADPEKVKHDGRKNDGEGAENWSVGGKPRVG